MPNGLRTVVLLHTLPDGSWHYDWLLEREGQAGLTTFRCDRSPGEGHGPIRGEAIGDHRRTYLDYEGPLSGGRGAVRRVAAGIVERAQIGPDAAEFAVDFGSGPIIWRGARMAEGVWEFTATDGARTPVVVP